MPMLLVIMGLNKVKENVLLCLIPMMNEWLETHLESSLYMLRESKADGIYGSLILRNNKYDSTFVTRKIKDNETTVDFLLSTCYGRSGIKFPFGQL